MRIYYHCSKYISHQRAGSAYKSCLENLGHELTDTPVQSDLIVIHDEPSVYPAIVRQLPHGIPRVGYAVWETPQLPEVYRTAVSLVDAVWTCSEFSRQAFAPHVPTFLLPHVVQRQRVSQSAIRRMAQRLLLNQDKLRPFLFYTIIDSVNPRKNFTALLAAFQTAFPDNDGDVRLVVKQYREARHISDLPNIINISDTLDDDEIGALHALCNAYVSAHHAEAWGLPISEAMSFGNPVIATGYSGNMEYMNVGNSIPVPYRIVPVTQDMCCWHPLFTRDMTWADISIPALVRALRRVYRDSWTATDRSRVAASTEAFSARAIEAHLCQLLDAFP